MGRGGSSSAVPSTSHYRAHCSDAQKLRLFFGCGDRDLGPVRGEVPLLFGHTAALPKGRAARAFDPARDIREGNLVAILISDEDAADWGRRFDIGRVTDVTPHGADAKVCFKVRYYECDYVHREQNERGCLAYLAGESLQLDGRWSEGTAVGEVHSDNVLCEAWVEKYGAQKGRLHAEYRKQLEEALERSEEL